MKNFINKPEQIVNQAISGLLKNQKLSILDSFPDESRVIIRSDWDKSKVAIISGGGSGHEPAHAGFIGKGMITAAVCGDIFASPPIDAILSAILAVTGKEGSLVIIKNYTGDRINFGLAVEQAKSMGYKVESVIVDDDIALGQNVQKRGVAGTLFVHKITGFLAEQGKSLEEIKNTANQVIKNTFSIGLALEECQHLGQKHTNRLTENQAELGLGIHGEPGIEIIKFDSADNIMIKVTDKIKEYINQKDNYALIMNNLGSVTDLEMNILVDSFFKTEISKNVKYLIGPSVMMSSLNMNGFSISLLKLENEVFENALIDEVENKNWKIIKIGKIQKIKTPELPKTIIFEKSENKNTENLIRKIADFLISSEQEINEIDIKVGDGDTGTSFATMGKKVLEYIDLLPLNNNAELLTTIGRILARYSGGSSGVLLSILFISAGNSFKNNPNLGQALLDGLQKMKDYGGANIGNRTMIDALQPAFKAIKENPNDLENIKIKTRKGADSTKNITNTKFGRSSYLSEQVLHNIPDPGAEIIARIFENI